MQRLLCERKRVESVEEQAIRRVWARTRPVTPPLPALEWAEANATLVLPGVGQVPFQPYAYQAALLQDYHPHRLVLKARQTGVSNACAIEALYYALTVPNTTVLFISKSEKVARVLIRYVRHALAGLTAPTSFLAQQNQGELAWENGSRLISLPANPGTGRSFAASRVYLDEFAFCEYDQLIYESVVPTLSHGGQLTVLSTPNGRANLFFRLWLGMEGGDWSRHEIHWSDCPPYRDDPAWEPTMRATLPRQSFAQEYDCDFLASGDAVFDPADLARCADGYVPDPALCDRYITAWDIGRRQDHTVGVTLGRREDTWHLVAYERFLAPYPEIQARIAARVAAFPGTEHYVEYNGTGDAVIENLTVSVTPFLTTARSKTQAIQALQLLIQQGQFKFQEPQLGRELGLYQWRDQGLIQDSVMATAIAAHATQYEPIPENAIVEYYAPVNISPY